MSQRRRRKLVGFAVAEGSAGIALVLAGAFAFFLNAADSTLLLSINIATIAAAIALAIIPILFFGFATIPPADSAIGKK